MLAVLIIQSLIAIHRLIGKRYMLLQILCLFQPHASKRSRMSAMPALFQCIQLLCESIFRFFKRQNDKLISAKTINICIRKNIPYRFCDLLDQAVSGIMSLAVVYSLQTIDIRKNNSYRPNILLRIMFDHLNFIIISFSVFKPCQRINFQF